MTLEPDTAGSSCNYNFDLVFLCSVRRLLAMANVVPSSPILVTLMMEALDSSETSVLTRATQRNIPEEVSAVKISHLTAEYRGSTVACLSPFLLYPLPESDLQYSVPVDGIGKR
jgi:hypothetical protein